MSEGRGASMRYDPTVTTHAQVSSATVLAVRGGQASARADSVATEEPLEIRVEGPDGRVERVAVAMRTPGHDLELAVGFLATEGLIRGRDDLAGAANAELSALSLRANVVTVPLARPFDASRLQRNFYATSSCGICGKAALEHVAVEAPAIEPGLTVPASVLPRMAAVLRGAQAAFERTGGLHAAGVFDAGGALLLVREDVGRHNALDKVIGRLLLDRALPAKERVIMVSGRVSFELVQKAAMAGAPVLCAVSAPSSLALEAATRLGITVVGFLRGDGFNVYTHRERLVLAR